MEIIPEPLEFEWDKGNQNKSYIRHKVSSQEAEQVFIDPLKHIIKDTIHSKKEDRYIILGHSQTNRILFVAFTIRSSFVRVISARDTSKKERKWYEEKIGFTGIQK
jgi:uncharacterized DUF497 family protein